MAHAEKLEARRAERAEPRPLRIAIADPPYLGQCAMYGHDHRSGCWDDITTHVQLMLELEDYDGWALHMSSPSLARLLPLAPPDTRVAAWVKPWASWKPGIAPAYAWEPVLVRPARHVSDEHKVRDYLASHPVTGAEFPGAKPLTVTLWVLRMLGAEPDDEVADLFPGSGMVSTAIAQWRQQPGLWSA